MGSKPMSIRTQKHGAEVKKGIDIELMPLDEDHVRARLNWREQDTGGGTLMIEVTVRKDRDEPKSEEKLKADARALAVRFARAFADTIEG
jgi:hypothetical protein